MYWSQREGSAGRQWRLHRSISLGRCCCLRTLRTKMTWSRLGQRIPPGGGSHRDALRRHCMGVLHAPFGDGTDFSSSVLTGLTVQRRAVPSLLEKIVDHIGGATPEDHLQDGVVNVDASSLDGRLDHTLDGQAPPLASSPLPPQDRGAKKQDPTGPRRRQPCSPSVATYGLKEGTACAHNGLGLGFRGGLSGSRGAVFVSESSGFDRGWCHQKPQDDERALQR